MKALKKAGGFPICPGLLKDLWEKKYEK